MKWFRRALEIEPETTKAKFFLLVVDKLVIGLFVLIVIGAFLLLRSDWEATRTERVAEAQISLERTRLLKEILPFILQESSDVMASGYLLSSALSAKQFDAQVAIEIVPRLHARGLPDSHFLRIAELAIPDGLPAIASRAAHLQENSKERLLWADALRRVLPYVSTTEEQQIVTRKFLTRYVGNLFFLFQPIIRATECQFLFFSDSRVLRLVGALDCAIANWGPNKEAADFIGNEFAMLNLKSKEDLSYGLALINVLYDYSKDRDRLTPYMAEHLAQLVVDDSFFHRISWIPKSASRTQRDQWFSERTAANIHSSIQYRAGYILASMGQRAGSAEGVLISFMEEFVDNVEGEQDPKSLSRLSSRYGKYAVRTAVAVLMNLGTEKARMILKEVRELGDEKHGHFDGLRGIIRNLETEDQQ